MDDKITVNELSVLTGYITGAPDKARNMRIDELEVAMVKSDHPVIDIPIDHKFTPGMYERRMLAPAFSFIVSKIHKTEHRFKLSKGSLSVWDDDGKEIRLTAPYEGITKPGTRRVAFTWEDVIWTTYHETDGTETVEQIEDRIIEKRDNTELTEALKNKIQQSIPFLSFNK